MRQRVTDDGTEFQIPETPFERWLLEQVMRAAGAFGEGRPIYGVSRAQLSIRMAEEEPWDEQGRRRCYLLVEDPLGDPFDVLECEQFPIWLSVAERPGPASEAFRGAVYWEMPANRYASWMREDKNQSNRFPDWPVLKSPEI